jgi:aldehyde dehydrogenase (NAD+)
VESSEKHWIGGEWVSSHGRKRYEVVNPATEEVVAVVAGGDADDVDRAVRAAARAFRSWSRKPLEERLEVLGRTVAELRAAEDELTSVIVEEVGTPVTSARRDQVGIAIALFESFIDVAHGFPFREKIGLSEIWREPVGVVACITPWNLPLILAAQKLPAALVAGCTVVLKPSEVTPLHALRLAECFASAGIPPGVVNIVVGDGPTAGEALVAHPDVAKVSFTGSTWAGRRVGELAAARLKRIGLELGGKNANLVLPDGDLERAVVVGVRQACFNAGQSCIAWSRLVVPRSRAEEAEKVAVRELQQLRVGDPRCADTDVGPLVSRSAQQRVRGYIVAGQREGARVVTGGTDLPDGLTRGFYLAPTLLGDVTARMTVGQEEIFGPVLCLQPYDDVEEAVELVNSTAYGLHGSIWSEDQQRALAVAREVQVGVLNVNGYEFDPLAPFGGYKSSGLGRELGPVGLGEFLEYKAIRVVA